MAKKASTPTQADTAQAAKKQMKIWLATNEHAVVTTAASMAGRTVTEYMKAAVLKQAKEDAKLFLDVFDSLEDE
jgi:uncharacterized protein (DUF1778 family)